jgi:Fe-S-cluster containining protein
MSGPPQLLTSEECLPCPVCCRFPERDSSYRPYCTAREVAALAGAGHPLLSTFGVPAPAGVGDVSGAAIQLVPDADGAGHHCSFLTEATHACQIFASRPLDCQLYPLMLVLQEPGDRVGLHLDPYCPHAGSFQEHPRIITDVAAWVEDHAGELAAAPELVTDEVPELRIVAELPGLSRALGLGGGWHRLRLQDREIVEAANRAGSGPVTSHRGFVPLFLHRHGHGVLWSRVGPHLAVVALDRGRPWVPVAPLGPPLDVRVLDRLEETLTALGGGGTVHLPAVREADRKALEAAGFTVRVEAELVVASRAEVAALRGRRFRAHRNLVRRAERSGRIADLREATAADVPGVLALWGRWWRARSPAGTHARLVATEALGMLGLALAVQDALDLVVLVLTGVDGRILGCTAAAPLEAGTMVVLFEFAERDPPGLAQLLARELAARLGDRCAALDLMDDAGLEGVAFAKGRYGGPRRPVLGALRPGSPRRE